MNETDLFKILPALIQKQFEPVATP